MAAVMTVVSVVMLGLLVVQLWTTVHALRAMERYRRKQWSSFTPEQRRRAMVASGLGFAVSTALAVGLASGDHGVVLGITIFFAIYGVILAPLAIWLDRRMKVANRTSA